MIIFLTCEKWRFSVCEKVVKRAQQRTLLCEKKVEKFHSINSQHLLTSTPCATDAHRNLIISLPPMSTETETCTTVVKILSFVFVIILLSSAVPTYWTHQLGKRQTRCAMDSLARNERRHSEKWVEDKKIIIFFSRKACHGSDHDGNPSTTIIRVWLFPSRGRERETLPLIFHASIYNRVIIIEDKQSSLSHRELLFLFAARRISVKEASWQADYCASMRDAFCHAMSWNTPREISTIVFAARFQRCLH